MKIPIRLLLLRINLTLKIHLITQSTSKKIVQDEEVELSYEDLAKLSASVVMIVVCNNENKPFKSGSGVVINNEGYILTNLHVVNDGYSFLVRFENDDKVYTSYQIINTIQIMISCDKG
ncbi:hypothetical protein RHK18_18400 [Clostridioides difficile]|nr:hypothetical protein [Clostridioides difficile]